MKEAKAILSIWVGMSLISGIVVAIFTRESGISWDIIMGILGAALIVLTFTFYAPVIIYFAMKREPNNSTNVFKLAYAFLTYFVIIGINPFVYLIIWNTLKLGDLTGIIFFLVVGIIFLPVYTFLKVHLNSGKKKTIDTSS